MSAANPPTEPLDLNRIERSMVKVRALVPEEALTASVLGTERIGSGIVIDPRGLVLTIGYLVAEASDVWLTLAEADGAEIAAHPLAYDQVTGFGLVMPLQRLDRPHLPLGSASSLIAGSAAHVLAYPAFAKPQAVRVLARREFAGSWEYLLEDAIFTVPPHPHWSGAALVGDDGRLAGLGSLLVREHVGGVETNANMFVPIDLLPPILEDLLQRGRAARPPRPWLGLYVVETEGKVSVTGVSERGPAQVAGMREGDVITHVAQHAVGGLAEFYRQVWASGPAGSAIRLTIVRRGSSRELSLPSVDRNDLLKRPQAH